MQKGISYASGNDIPNPMQLLNIEALAHYAVGSNPYLLEACDRVTSMSFDDAWNFIIECIRSNSDTVDDEDDVE